MPRFRKNYVPPNPSETLMIALDQLFEKITVSDESEFPLISSLTAEERAYVHYKAHRLGLQSKSKGKGDKRFITIYKREGSTIVQKDAVLRLTSQSRQLLEGLNARYPLSHRERQDLLPPTERDRNQSMDLVRDMKIGKLASSRPMQIPPAGKPTAEMERWRKSLPVYKKREEILHTISSNPVCIIQGETGCGKTTQIPQYILEQCREQRSPCRIIVTEPRRLACTSVCERVCAERNESPGTLVGYQIRLESKLSPDTLLTFCTPGIVLTSMLNEATISNISHIIVDEVHERDRFCDFLLICLRELRIRFPQLRIVLMSATVNTQLFEKYFTCPVIKLAGRTFPVREHYLLDALKLTGYMTPKMLEYQKLLKKDGKCDPVAVESVVDTGQGSKVPQEEAIKEIDNCMEQAFNQGSEDNLMQLIHLLLSEGYPIDYRHSTTHMTALMVAAARNHIPMVETLLKYGANTSLRTRAGQTALELAIAASATEAAAYLKNVVEVVESTEEEISASDKILLESYIKCDNSKGVDADLIAKLIMCLLKTKGTGGILVFLPGCEEIIRVRDQFRAEESKSVVRPKCRVFLLHSQFRNDTKAVFKPLQDRARKVILATNIAETSITIDDVVYVIDAGKVKQKSMDVLNGGTIFETDWISKSCAEQRKGRAGRVLNGICYRLYSKQRFLSFEQYTCPEIMRTPLADLCLQAKLFAQNNCTIAEFLGKAVEPPAQRLIRDATQLLKTIDALNAWEDLTPLGICLLNLSTDPRFGKMLLYSVILKCLDPVLTIVASLDTQDAFILPTWAADRIKAQEIRKNLAEDTFSDHFVLLRAYQEWQQALANHSEMAYCEKHFISPTKMEMIHATRTQLLGQLRSLGLIRKQTGDMRDLNTNSDSWAVVKVALCAGLYPNLARVDREQNVIRTRKECKVTFHQSSVLKTNNVISLATDWILYTELVKVGPFSHFRTCTLVTPLTVALVCCPTQGAQDSLHDDGFRPDLADPLSDSDVEDEVPNSRMSLTVDEWVELSGNLADVNRITYARFKLQSICLRRLTACVTPSKANSSSQQSDDAFIKAIVNVISLEDKAANLVQPLGVGQRPKNVDMMSEGPQGNHHNNANQRNRTWQQIPRADGSTTRYFVVRSPSVKALELAFVRSSWQFSKNTEKKLREAREEGGELILFFAAYQTFHGVAKLGMGQPQMGLKWPLHWIKKHAVPIDAARSIPLPEELRNQPLNRDGLELPEHVGRSLMRLWERSLMGPKPSYGALDRAGLPAALGYYRNF